jgi:hypothetical protein
MGGAEIIKTKLFMSRIIITRRITWLSTNHIDAAVQLLVLGLKICQFYSFLKNWKPKHTICYVKQKATICIFTAYNRTNKLVFLRT